MNQDSPKFVSILKSHKYFDYLQNIEIEKVLDFLNVYFSYFTPEKFDDE